MLGVVNRHLELPCQCNGIVHLRHNALGKFPKVFLPANTERECHYLMGLLIARRFTGEWQRKPFDAPHACALTCR